jgi:lipooligosaccharide transport system permease protein
MQPVAWVSPLWHGTEVARAAALDRWEPLPALGHTAFLLALLGLGAFFATRLFTRRLQP